MTDYYLEPGIFLLIILRNTLLHYCCSLYCHNIAADTCTGTEHAGSDTDDIDIDVDTGTAVCSAVDTANIAAEVCIPILFLILIFV